MNEGNSRLIQLPPKLNQDEREQLDHVVRSDAPEDLARQGLIDAHIVSRVLRRGQTFANYRILGFIAAGGMGEVYVAERLEDDGPRRRPVALKVVSPELMHDPDTITRLEREAELATSVDSKHTVTIYEYGVSERGRAFVAMEFMFGEELFGRMRALKVLPLKMLAELAVNILYGLEDIHAAGIVHRDIKPENIFLCKTRRGEVPKLLDFGIARKLGEAQDPLLKHPGQIFGTPQYLSPEQCINPTVDHRSDLYSLGVVLYECAAGSPPFDRETPWATMLAHQQDPIPPLPSTLDIEFSEIILKALAKNPQDRWQSAQELRLAIERWIDETSWVDGLPGIGGFDPSEISFSDLERQAQAARHNAQTPQGVPSAASVMRRMSAKNAADAQTRSSDELEPYLRPKPETPIFPMQQVLAPDALLKDRAPSSGQGPQLGPSPGRMAERVPLLSSPIELAPTLQEQQRALARQAAQQPRHTSADASTSSSSLLTHASPGPEPRVAGRGLTLLIVGLVIAGVLAAAAIVVLAKPQKTAQPAEAPSIIE